MSSRLSKAVEELAAMVQRLGEIVSEIENAGRNLASEDVPPGLDAVAEVGAIQVDDLAALVSQAFAAGGCAQCGRLAEKGEVPATIDFADKESDSPAWTCRRCVPPLVILGPGGEFTQEIRG